MRYLQTLCISAGLVVLPICVQAQELNAFQLMVQKISEAAECPPVLVDEKPVTPPQDVVVTEEASPLKAEWKVGAMNSLNFSQMALSNWAAGGQGSVALNAYTDWSANMSKGKHRWDNRFQAAYGFIQPFGEQYKKSDDKLILDSKWGYQAYDKLFFSAAFNFRSQMTTGFDYPSNADPVEVSKFMSPAYFTLGLGLDYKPYDFISINFAPLTGKLIVVSEPGLRLKYGNAEDQKIRAELGAQLKIDIKKEVFKNVTIATDLTLFSNYVKDPQNIKVQWNLLIDMKVNKFLSANLRTNIIYDDTVLITDSNGATGPRLQIKEVLGVGLTYSFGSAKK